MIPTIEPNDRSSLQAYLKFGDIERGDHQHQVDVDHPAPCHCSAVAHSISRSRGVCSAKILVVGAVQQFEAGAQPLDR
jgi:hypothetical protein